MAKANRCEGCNAKATTTDSEGVPLCKACYIALDHEMPEPAMSKTVEGFTKEGLARERTAIKRGKTSLAKGKRTKKGNGNG